MWGIEREGGHLQARKREFQDLEAVEGACDQGLASPQLLLE